jgi:hypothetical protein
MTDKQVEALLTEIEHEADALVGRVRDLRTARMTGAWASEQDMWQRVFARAQTIDTLIRRGLKLVRDA